MKALEKITRSNFFIKLRNWEYWPFGIIQFPSMLYWLWLSLRSRSLLFFSASNPGIAMGGMFGESKCSVLEKIPPAFVPKTRLVKLPVTKDQVIQMLQAEGFSFPVIFKPDLGERGFMVKRIHSETDIESYIKKIKIDFIIQDIVELPLEFGVYYVRFPSHQNGTVTSVVTKEWLSVTGNGNLTLQELIMKKDRAKLQWKKLKEIYKDQLHEILPNGKMMELVSVGNHALGTKFLNGSHLINKKLSLTFDSISKQIEGFYYGRFDIRCTSLEDLYAGNIKILELNGCGAEPVHIYDPQFTLAEAMRVLFKHWRTIYEISRENNKLGAQYTTLKQGLKYYQKFKAATK